MAALMRSATYEICQFDPAPAVMRRLPPPPRWRRRAAALQRAMASDDGMPIKEI